MLASTALTSLPPSAFTSLEAAAHAQVPALAAYAVRVTLVLFAAWIVTGVLRGAAAATRHAVWAVGVLVVAALPLLSSATPRIEISMRGLPSVATALSAVPERSVSRAQAPAASRTHIPPASNPAITTVPIMTRRPPTVPERRSVSLDLWTMIEVLWALGTMCLIGRSVLGTVLVWRRSVAAEPVREVAWMLLAREVTEELGIRRPVTLLMTRVPTVPVTWGLVYPAVLLPIEASEWPQSRRRAVLLHELAHVARLDAGTQLLGQLVLAANWFNPLAWVAVRCMRAERERACDDVVLRRGTQASAYANDLLTIVRTLQAPGAPGFAALAMARHAELEGRLRFILDADCSRGTPSPRSSMLSLVTAAPFIVLLAAIHPSARTVRRALSPLPAQINASPAPERQSSATSEITSGTRTPTSATSQAARSARLTTSPATPTSPATADAPTSLALTAIGSASPASSLMLPRAIGTSTRCPFETETAQGGVSAQPGEVSALELKNDDHRVLITASDAGCVTAQLDGWVIVSDDDGEVTGLGTGAHLTMVDSTDGNVRRVEVSRAEWASRARVWGSGVGAVPSPVDTAASRIGKVNPDDINSPLYVVDGAIVDSFPPGSRIPSTSRGYYARSVVRPDSSRDWIIQKDDQATEIEGTPLGAAEVIIPETMRRDSVGIAANSVGGAIVYQYFVDGKASPWSGGEGWFRTTLADVLRQTGYNAQSRVAFLRRHGGVSAVLDEIRQVRSGIGLRAYFDALIATGKLSPDEVAQAISVAQSTLTDQADRDRILSRLEAMRSQSNRYPDVHVF